MTNREIEPTAGSLDDLRIDESVAIAGPTTAADLGEPPMRTDQSDPDDETAARGLVSTPTSGRAVIYLRVSTTEQAETDFSDEGFSIPAQREACRRKAEHLGAVVVDEYLDRGESARSAARPQLQSMLGRLRVMRDVDYVIVHKIDRLARSREDDVNIVMDIRHAGAQIVSASENIDESPSGKLLHGIMATIAEFYSSNLAAEARKGMEQKAKLGGTPYRAPVGYLNSIATVDGRQVRTITVDEERAVHVRWAFETFACGEWTVSQLTEALGDRGLTSKGDKRYAPQPLNRSKVHRMLRNSYYVGKVTFNGVQHRGRHAPLVTTALFDDVQAVLDGRRGTEKPVKRTHYLKGILACGHCGRRLGVSWSSSKSGTKYPYFFCLGRRAHESNGCTLPYLPMEQVERDVEIYWAKVRVAASEIAAIRSGVTDLIRLAAQQHQDDLAEQRLRLDRLTSEEQKLLAAHYADAVSLPLLQREQQRILGERASAEGMIAALTMESEAMERTLEEALARIDRCDEVYRQGSRQVRRELCFALFNRLFIAEEGVVRSDLASPYAEILDPSLPDHLEAQKAVIAEGRLRDLLINDDPSDTDPSASSGPSSPDGEPGPAGISRCSNLSLLVDLWGRLSNPSEILETIANQGWSSRRRHPGAAQGAPGRAGSGFVALSSEQRGRLSNPVQRRLSDAEIQDLIRRYITGESIDALAHDSRIHRTTVMSHLERAGVERRRLVRKMTDDTVARAAARYGNGASLAVVAQEFGVHSRTLAREFRRGGVSIRPRRGW